MTNLHVSNISETSEITDLPNITEEIITEVTKKAFKIIEKEALKFNCTIFGGYVRDKINNTTPSDIDICFKLKKSIYEDEKYKEFDNFIKVIRNIKEFNNIKQECNHGKYHLFPNIDRIIKLTITLVLGNIPFVHDGIKLNINVDILCISHDVDIEPPFKHLDMSCNALIETSAGIRLSRHTGIQILDELSDENRIIITAEIIKLIKKSKGYLIFNYDPSSVNIQEVSLRRFLKIRPKIKFLNLPFGEQLYNKDEGKCKIPYCSTEYTSLTNVVYTECKIKNIYCENCMIQYLAKQHENFKQGYHNELVCPHKVKIDFTLCKEKFIDFVKNILNEL